MLVLALAVCKLPPPGRPSFDPKNQTYAELRLVLQWGEGDAAWKEPERAPHARERLADGAEVSLDAHGLAWLRRDGGATLLIAGPAKLTLRTGELIVDEGKLFVDALTDTSADLITPKGPLHLSGVRGEPGLRRRGCRETQGERRGHVRARGRGEDRVGARGESR